MDKKKSGRKEELIERCVDGMMYGAIPRCPKCINDERGGATLNYNQDTNMYTCNGYFDKKSKKKLHCDFQSDHVERNAWRTPGM